MTKISSLLSLSFHKFLRRLFQLCIRFIKHHPNLKRVLINKLHLFPKLEQRLYRAYEQQTSKLSQPSLISADQSPTLGSKYIEKIYQLIEAHRSHHEKNKIQPTTITRIIHNSKALDLQYQQIKTTLTSTSVIQRPKLAYISPLPFARTGIADYSAELLPELKQYYEIDLIVSQEEHLDSEMHSYGKIRDVSWFKQHYHEYDRVLYQMGNSHFHIYMLEIIENYPGIVVLHDFHLSSIIAHLEINVRHTSIETWSQALYYSHGYNALHARFHSSIQETINTYPCNLNILESATGIIVHSDYSQKSATQWYGKKISQEWRKIPLLKAPPITVTKNKKQLKEEFGYSESDFIVCSFGLLTPAKLNDLLLAAWSNSELSKQKNCYLIFVGQPANDRHKHALENTIEGMPLKNNIRITGFSPQKTYQAYLCIADMAVQLRTDSKGETSGAVLDCMNYGIPTIVNANGPMAELPTDCVISLPDVLEQPMLVTALNHLWQDEAQRNILSQRAKNYLADYHSPEKIGPQYYHAIEAFYQGSATVKIRLLKALHTNTPLKQCEWIDMLAFGEYFHTYNKKQLFVDVSQLCEHDLKTGIHRLTRGILQALFLNPPDGYRIEPVYATIDREYYYARTFSLAFLDCPTQSLQDRPIEPRPGDIFLGLDPNPRATICHQDYLHDLQNLGVNVFFVIYDLLPHLFPQYFIPVAKQTLNQWLHVITQFQGAICISRTVMNDLKYWLEEHPSDKNSPLALEWFHPGADIEKTHPTKGLPKKFEYECKKISAQASILMVSTIEPRKGYAQTLSAFELLWKNGEQVSLVIVGKPGWMVEGLIKRIKNHKENGKRLFWYQNISDEALIKLYQVSTGVLVASKAEGFGLTIIEAAQYKKPMLLRDIPVFREIADGHAAYFPDKDSVDILAKHLGDWLLLLREGKAPASNNLPYLTWTASAKQLASHILNKYPTN
ncbi:MAG: glycosyltransferase [Gammaproteobacteria bacterium]|nr:glycosyltransferase [Gammaproteobacteria bacterium]